MHAYLVIGENERVCKYHILPSAGSKDNYLCNVVWRKGLTSLVDCICFCLIATKPYNGEFLYSSG